VEAISEKEGVKMTFPESGKAHQSLCLPNMESQEIKNLFREKMFQPWKYQRENYSQASTLPLVFQVLW